MLGVLLNLHLLVTEVVCDVECEAGNRNMYSLHIGEVFAFAVAVEIESSAFAQTCHTLNGNIQFVIEERFRQTSHHHVKSGSPSLKGVFLTVGDEEGTQFQIPRQCLL